MSSERERQRLIDIRDNIARARDFTKDMEFAEFAADVRTIYATIRALEIISEATRFLSVELKGRHPGIDWVAIRDAGNVYRHGYELVTEERVWDTVRQHLAPLEGAVLTELSRSN
jgi:uncharacterized protein with HEPN domain